VKDAIILSWQDKEDEMSYKNPDWKYRPHAETVKPGYLKRRFDEIRRKQREQAEVDKAAELERISKVRRIGK